MTLLHMDGFDHYGDDETKMSEGIYDSLDSEFSLSLTNPRTGKYSLRRDATVIDSKLIKSFGDVYTSIGHGFAFYLSELPSANYAYKLSGLNDINGLPQVVSVINTDGSVRILLDDVDGAIIAQSTSNVIQSGRFHHYEIACTADTSEILDIENTFEETFETYSDDYVVEGPAIFSTSFKSITIGPQTAAATDSATKRSLNFGEHVLTGFRCNFTMLNSTNADQGRVALLDAEGGLVFYINPWSELLQDPDNRFRIHSGIPEVVTYQGSSALNVGVTYLFSAAFDETSIAFTVQDNNDNVIFSDTITLGGFLRNAGFLQFGSDNDVNGSGTDTIVYSNVEIDYSTTMAPNPNGYVEVRIDGVTVISESSAQTVSTDIKSYSSCSLYGGSAVSFGNVITDFDDFYIWNDQGSWNNSFIGDRRCFFVKPNQDTNIADFEPSSGNFGYKMIDDESPDDDSSYIIAEAYLQAGSPLTGSSEFKIEDLPNGASLISAINVISRSSKTDNTSAEIYTSVNSGSDSLTGTSHTLTTSYMYYNDIYEYDPATIASLTRDGFNSISVSLAADDLESPFIAGSPDDVVSPEDSVSPTVVLWTPEEITTALWLDADDSSTITTVSGFVSQWDDKSGNGRNAVQATAARRPALASAELNGLDAVYFDGADDNMSIASLPTGQAAYSIYAVLRNDQDPPADAAQSGIWSFTNDAVSRNSHHPFTDGVLYHNFGTTSRKTLINPTPSLAAGHIFNVDSAASSWQARLNATQIFTTATNTVGIQSTGYIGVSNISDFLRFYDGIMCEIVMISSVLSQSDREKMEGYMAHKWGLESTLPGGHPYKSSPPEV